MVFPRSQQTLPIMLQFYNILTFVIIGPDHRQFINATAAGPVDPILGHLLSMPCKMRL